MTDLLELYQCAEQENVQVDDFPLENREALSLIDLRDRKCYVAIDPLKLTGRTDEKMKLAHELGHCMTGSFYNQYAACDIRQQHENRADKWAIQKLVPINELCKAITEGYTDWEALADHFDVSVAFMRKAACWYMYGNLSVDLYFD